MRLITTPLFGSRVGLRVPLYRCFSTGSMLRSVTEVQDGSRFIEERNIPAAVEHLERAIKILPFYQVGDVSYNSEFDDVVSNLVQAYAWQGDRSKVTQLVEQAISTNLAGKAIVRARQVLAAINLESKQNWQNPRIQTIHSNLFSLKQRGITASVERLYSNNAKSEEVLGEWEQGNIGEAAAYLLSTLQSDQSFANKKGFNSFCSSFLKQCERGSPKNVIKALIIMNCNTIRKEQFLQSEGLLNYCIDRKKQNVKAALLAVNQQYHLLQLLMARVYSAVDRQEEAKRLTSHHQPLFNWDTLMLQTLLIESL